MDLTREKRDRILLGTLFLAYAVGTPGFGIDTRTGSSAILGAIYSVAVLTLLLALGASWKWPRAAAWSALLGGAFAVTLAALDLMGALAGPPPGGMLVLDPAILALGLVIAWRNWPATRATPRRLGSANET